MAKTMKVKPSKGGMRRRVKQSLALSRIERLRALGYLDRPNGGHRYHIRPKDSYTALCGYRPSSPRAFRMVGRACWTNAGERERMGCTLDRLCPACVKKADAMEEDNE